MERYERCFDKWIGLFLLSAVVLSIQHCTPSRQRTDMKPPVAKKIPKELTKHGDTRVDNYFWLNQREDQEVLDYLKAENEYTAAMLGHTKDLQEDLYDEMVGRIKQDDNTVPYLKNGYYYYVRYEQGNEYPIFARKKGSLDADEEIMLNVNDMARGYDFYRVVGLEVSEDNRILSFGVDTVSRRRYTIHFKNLETGELRGETIPNTTGRAVWANDNAAVFYTTKDTTLRPDKIMRHILGSDPASDVELFHEKDNTFGTIVYKSKSGRYLFIGSYSTLSTEFQYLDADNPMGTFKMFQPRGRDHEYSIWHYGDKFYIRTNWKAKNFRLMETDVRHTGRNSWREVVPHRSDVLLEDVDIFKDHLVLSERKDGLRQLRVINQADQSEHYVQFPEDAYVAYATDNYEFDTKTLRYVYTSLTTPGRTYDYDMDSREQVLLKQEEVVGGYDPSQYQTERIYAKARDGAKVPVSLVYRKDLRGQGPSPLLLYGYGSYGISMDPNFNSSRLSLIDRGFIFAIAHVRGGQEMGRDWYENGKLLKKKNTFTDFIDCGQFLIDEGYTSPDHLFAQGGSAGGLLMGAIVNMRPDLFKGVIAAVPWVDVVTTMLDESIPLTTGEYDEWGNPNDKKYYDYMLSYSPYDNVAAQAYPAMLVTTGLHDSQVQYFEPTKWVAKLRATKTDNNLLVLDVDMESGHGGASGRFKRFKRVALEYAFLLDQEGIED